MRYIVLVHQGIPPVARCQVWQILSGAINDTKRLEAYAQFLTKVLAYIILDTEGSYLK